MAFSAKSIPPGLSTSLKVTGNRTTYEPLELSDASVYDMARHWYTMDEIAERFSVTKQTLIDKHFDAFQRGKAEGFNKPRMLLNKILTDFLGEDGEPVNFARPDVPVHNLLKAIELHAKKYEGLGSKQTIVHEGKVSYDGVETKPVIIDKP